MDEKSCIFDTKWCFLAQKWWKCVWKRILKMSHIWMKWPKSNLFQQCENWMKKVQKMTFSYFLMQFPNMCVNEKWNYIDILHAKTTKNHVKKHVKNGKSHNFQKALKSSKKLQIMFWIAKNRCRVFWPESKIWKNFIMPMFGRKKFSRHVCVFCVFKKVKKLRFCF